MTEIEQINETFSSKIDAAYAAAPPFSAEMDSEYQNYHFKTVSPLWTEWRVAVMRAELLGRPQNTAATIK